MAGVDPHDNHTSAIPHSALDYTKALRTNALKGKRIGVPRKFASPEFSNITQVELAAFDRALDTLRELGATVVEHTDLNSANEYLNLSFAKDPVMQVDFKVCVRIARDCDMPDSWPEQRELNAYYAGLVSNPSGVRTIADLVAFNDAHPDLEKPTGYEDQF
jgi:amidase